MLTRETVDRVTLVNFALNEIGEPMLFSDDGQDDFDRAVRTVWQVTVDECFALHDWDFCLRTVKLTRLAEQPDNGWRYGHTLPGHRLGPPLKLLASRHHRHGVVRDFDIEGHTVFSECEELWARIKVIDDPETWDGAFRQAFVTALASRLAVPVKQDMDLADELRTLAFGTISQGGTGGKFGRLIAQDRAAHPVASPLYSHDPLTAARYS